MQRRTGHVTYTRGARAYRRRLGHADTDVAAASPGYMASFTRARKGQDQSPLVDADPAAHIQDMDLEGVDVHPGGRSPVQLGDRRLGRRERWADAPLAGRASAQLRAGRDVAVSHLPGPQGHGLPLWAADCQRRRSGGGACESSTIRTWTKETGGMVWGKIFNEFAQHRPAPGRTMHTRSAAPCIAVC